MGFGFYSAPKRSVGKYLLSVKKYNCLLYTVYIAAICTKRNAVFCIACIYEVCYEFLPFNF